MTMMLATDHSPTWDWLSSACGVLYFASWSASFYPQLILNYQRKSAVGLSADFTWINPLGFLALTIWSFGAYFSPLAREQYRARHDGHNPQVSKSDLGFALHGFILSSAQFLQVYYYTYFYRKKRAAPLAQTEEDPLLPEREDTDFAITSQPTQPSLIFKVLIAVAWVAAISGGMFVWIGNFQFLDWLYLVSTIKLAISIIKFIPQVLLNWRLKSSEGFSVAMPALDLAGGVLSLLQLVVSSVYIEHDPSGIIANPVKLGLAFQSIIFDLVFLFQKLYLYRNASDPAREVIDE